MKKEFTIQDIVEKAGKLSAQHIDFLALAFLEETGLHPSECELVQQQTAIGYRWFYRKLTKDASAQE